MLITNTQKKENLQRKAIKNWRQLVLLLHLTFIVLKLK